MMKTSELLDLQRTIAAGLFEGRDYPWNVLDDIGSFILKLGATLPTSEYDSKGENIWIAKDAIVFDTACIKGPCIIDHGAEVRHCAFLRGNVIVGKNAVVGNSTEIKNSILFDSVQAPHYNYIGDSILGYKAHMGAGSITSNIKSDRTDVVIKDGAAQIPTGRRKVGAILGNRVEVGCNSVLNPGTVVGPNSTIYPLSSVRGIVPPSSIYKRASEIVEKTTPVIE